MHSSKERQIATEQPCANNGKAQSAIEYLMTYSWTILITAVVLGLLYFIGAFTPASNVATYCTLPSQLSCISASLAYNGNLLINLGQSLAPTINITSIGCSTNSMISNIQTINPPISIPIGGNATILTRCYENGTVATRKVGNIYNGYLTINYTNPASHFSHTVVGTLLLKATAPTILHYVPITLQNSQSTPTPVSFQQMITVNSLAYQSYEVSGLQNVEFTTGAAGTGAVLQAWIESNAINSATNTIYWVKLPGTIPANGNIIIYMDFMPRNVMSSYGPTGEAPQLSTSYGQYDNGASMFNFYDSFTGTTINSQYTQVPLTGTTITQSNGITISTNPSATYGGLVLTGGLSSSPTFVFEGSITAVSGVAAGFALQTGNLGNSNGYDFNYWSGSVTYGSMSGGMAGAASPNLQVSVGIDSGAWLSSSSQTWYKNYVATAGTQTTYTLPSTIYPSIGIYASSVSTSITFQWIRSRNYPPNGVMPSASAGSVV